ncbi:MAG: S8 family serine peptidase [Thermoplasmata archaeon]
MVAMLAGRRSGALILCLILLAAASYPPLSGCVKKRPAETPPPGPSLWALEAVQIDELQAMGYSGRGVVIALVDTGVDLSHPDLRNLSILGWLDLVNGEPVPYDDGGHGTMMAGIIAGVWGGAPNASLYIVKAIRSDGTSTDARVAEAVRRALDPDGDGDRRDAADIISLSLGGGRIPLLGTETERAVKEALSWGTLVVAAADNDGESDDGEVASPASVALVIAVGAVDRHGKIAPFSSAGANRGSLFPPILPRQDPNKKPEVVAPGVDIWCAVPGGGHQFASGTSHATAFVSAALALVLEARPEYQQERNGGETTIIKFKEALMETALAAEGQSVPHDDHYGYGLLQARALCEVLLA